MIAFRKRHKCEFGDDGNPTKINNFKPIKFTPTFYENTRNNGRYVGRFKGGVYDENGGNLDDYKTIRNWNIFDIKSPKFTPNTKYDSNNFLSANKGDERYKMKNLDFVAQDKKGEFVHYGLNKLIESDPWSFRKYDTTRADDNIKKELDEQFGKWAGNYYVSEGFRDKADRMFNVDAIKDPKIKEIVKQYKANLISNAAQVADYFNGGDKNFVTYKEVDDPDTNHAAPTTGLVEIGDTFAKPHEFGHLVHGLGNENTSMFPLGLVNPSGIKIDKEGNAKFNTDKASYYEYDKRFPVAALYDNSAKDLDGLSAHYKFTGYTKGLYDLGNGKTKPKDEYLTSHDYYDHKDRNAKHYDDKTWQEVYSDLQEAKFNIDNMGYGKSWDKNFKLTPEKAAEFYQDYKNKYKKTLRFFEMYNPEQISYMYNNIAYNKNNNQNNNNSTYKTTTNPMYQDDYTSYAKYGGKFRGRNKAFWGALIGTAANLIGGAISSSAQAKEAEEQRQAQERAEMRSYQFQTNQYVNNLKSQAANLEAQQSAERDKILATQKSYNDNALATTRTNMASMLNNNDAARNKNNSVSYKYGGIKRNRHKCVLGSSEPMFNQTRLNESLVENSKDFPNIITQMNDANNSYINKLKGLYNTDVATQRIVSDGLVKTTNNNMEQNNNSISTSIASANPLLLNKSFKYGGKYRKRFGLGGAFWGNVISQLGGLAGSLVDNSISKSNNNVETGVNNTSVTPTATSTPINPTETPQQTVNNYANFTNNAMNKVNNMKIGNGFRPRNGYGILPKFSY